MSESDLAVAASSPADRVALGAMQAALAVARETGEDRAIVAFARPVTRAPFAWREAAAGTGRQ